MKLAYKAAIYSALIYPGGGHFLLRRFAPGIAFAGVATACLLVLLFRVMEIAQSIADRILTGEIPYDIGRIHAEISLGALAAGSPEVSIATWLLVACWIIAAIDAFRLGRQRDLGRQAGADRDGDS